MSFGIPPFSGGIGASFKILEILEYACGFRPTRIIREDGSSRKAGKLGPAANLVRPPKAGKPQED